MIVYKPEEITDAKIVASTLLEVEPFLWSEFSSFSINDLVGISNSAPGVVTVYKSLQNSNFNNPPASSPTWWVKLGDVYQEHFLSGYFPFGVRAQDSVNHLVYQSVVADASGYPLDQVATPAWTPLGKKVYLEPLLWATATAYAVGDVRRYQFFAPAPGGGGDILINERFYRCTVAHTSTTSGPSFPPDSANWVFSADYPRPFVIGGSYGLGYVVIDTDGEAYLSNITFNRSPFDNRRGWALVGTTNYWAVFDAESSSQSVANGTMEFTVAPGGVDAVALINAQADLVRVVVREGLGGAILFDQTSGVLGGLITDWWEYFHSDLFLDRRQLLFTGLPLTINAHITVTLTGATLALGDLIFSRGREVGLTGYGLNVGIKDFSVVKEDENFGSTTFVKRRNRKRMDARQWIQKDQFNRIFNLLSDLPATPCVWVAGDVDYMNEALMLKAWYKDFTTEINGPEELFVSLKLEGIV